MYCILYVLYAVCIVCCMYCILYVLYAVCIVCCMFCMLYVLYAVCICITVNQQRLTCHICHPNSADPIHWSQEWLRAVCNVQMGQKLNYATLLMSYAHVYRHTLITCASICTGMSWKTRFSLFCVCRNALNWANYYSERWECCGCSWLLPWVLWRVAWIFITLQDPSHTYGILQSLCDLCLCTKLL